MRLPPLLPTHLLPSSIPPSLLKICIHPSWESDDKDILLITLITRKTVLCVLTKIIAVLLEELIEQLQSFFGARREKTPAPRSPFL